MSGDDIVGLVLETLTILGISAGLLCLVIAVAIRLADGQWVATTALVVRGGDARESTLLRWMTEDGELHSRYLDAHEHEAVGPADDAAVYYRRRTPGRIRFTRRHEAERIFFVLAAVIGGVGVVCVCVSVVHAVTSA